LIREDLALSPFVQGLVVSDLPIGAAIGAAGGPLADGLGRRRLIILAALMFGLGGIGTALSVNAAMLVAFRIIMGMGIGISSVVVPLYLSEMAPTEIRGSGHPKQPDDRHRDTYRLPGRLRVGC
jgi:MFS family permease